MDLGLRRPVAPPLDRFYMGGDTDIRGFDIRAISPVAFFPTAINVPLQNPDGTTVPLNPANPRQGAYNITIPVSQIIFPGGDTNIVTNLEYRVPIVGPVTMAPFVDTGWDFVSKDSQLAIAVSAGANSEHYLVRLSHTYLDVSPASGGVHIPFSSNLPIVVRNQLSDAHVHRPGVASNSAHRECAVPHILGL